MNISEEEEAVERLLLLYCQGKTTSEESTQVERWIDQSEENLRIATQLYKINRAISDTEILERIDTEKALRQVKRSLQQQRLQYAGGLFAKVAAILLFPLLAFTLYLYYQLEKTPETPATSILEVRSTNGSTTRVSLPDHTTVCLNSQSVLRYPQQFNKDKREVTLDGEGYFEVTHQPASPFIVHLPKGQQVEVLGTTFNIEAYSNRNTVSTTLVEGRVSFLRGDKNVRKGISLHPGQKIVYDISKDSLASYQVDCATETAWKDGMIIFRNTALPEVIQQLEKRFDVSFRLANPNIKEYTFTGTFTEQALEPILESIQKASGICWQETKAETGQRQIQLYRKRKN